MPKNGTFPTWPTRRRFGQLSLAAGLVAASGMPRAAAQTPKSGGRLRMGLGGANTASSLDPATWGTGALIQNGVWPGVYNNLMEIAPNGDLVPELAESAEVSEGADRWVFRLRPGIEFQNGKTLEAADVVASINHHRGEESQSAAKGLVEQIEEIRAEDPLTVVVQLSEGNADFAYLMTDSHLVIGAATDEGVDWEAANGTGGYRLVENEPGVRLLFERNPNYWKEGRAHFAEVELIGINDVAARMNAIVTGEVEVINRVDPQTIHLFDRADHVVIEEVTGTQHYTMPMWVDTPPFDDVDVRLAMKLAVDREEMLQKVLRGHGRIANDHPIAPVNRFFAEALEQRSYDPEKARFHLRKAGHDRLAVDLHAADAAFEGAVDTAVLYQASAAAAGIDVNVVREPNDAYWSNVWTQVPFCMCYWGGRPTADWMFSQVYSSEAEWNDTHWRRPEFDRLLKEARVELDPDRRAEMYAEMQRMVRDDGGTIVPMYANYVDARTDAVAHGPDIAANWSLDGWKAIERWWFA